MCSKKGLIYFICKLLDLYSDFENFRFFAKIVQNTKLAPPNNYATSP